MNIINMSHRLLYLNFMIDCESTQPSIRNSKLGESASRGFAELIEKHNFKGNFYLISSEASASPALYKELHVENHEVGLHLHPSAEGDYAEYLGVYGPDIQKEILKRAIGRFSDALGFLPQSICVGYASINDYTCEILFELGFRHGVVSIPGRILPECASVHAGSPLDIHYTHRYNRNLVGDLDFVNIPMTVDPESRMWRGKHPQDLRVELVDAKNHFYTIEQALARQIERESPIIYLTVFTHNTFDYGQPNEFRRQTLEGIIGHVKTLSKIQQLEIVPATHQEIAAAYRKKVILGSTETKLTLDQRGYTKKDRPGK